ncbi:MAG: PAS domain S-box protein [Arcobacter sp.]|nr:PAS domain S-box protein [Arcobacter sp.]
MYKNIAYKMFFVVTAVIISIGLIGISSTYYLQKNNITRHANDNIEGYNQRFVTYTDEQAHAMESYLNLLENKKELQVSFIKSNKEELFKNAEPILKHLNANSDITHFYFIKPDGKVLLRVHDFNRSDDIVNRYTFLKAKETNKIFYGIEFGIKQNYTLRVVLPWIVEGKLIGYLELGKEINKISDILSKQKEIEIFYAVQKSKFKNSEKAIQEKLKSHMQTRDYYVMYQTLPSNKKIVDLMDTSDNNLKWLEIDNKHYIYYSQDLQDVSKVTLGRKVFLVDVTKAYDELLNSIISYSIIMFVITQLLLFLVFVLLRKKQIMLDDTFLKLQAQKEEFETVFEFSKDGIAILDLESNFLDFNEAYREMTGFTREELLQKSCNGLTSPEFKEASIKALATAKETGYIENIEKTCIVKDNKRINVNMSASLLPDKQRFLLLTKDITNLKALEEQSKLASMGEMIGNIAHQWRQPLSVISTNSTGMMMQQEYGLLTDEILISSCNQINENAQYLSKTIDDFRNFIQGDSNLEFVHVSKIINESLNILKGSLSNHYINLVLSIEDDIEINTNKNELEQAIINIVNNAKDAVADNVIEEDRAIFISTKKIDNKSLELKICDNGGGIPIDIITKIFEPYFTTKHKSRGTGLGLSMVNQIVRERYHQKLNVYNDNFTYNGKEFVGACFSIIFTEEG